METQLVRPAQMAKLLGISTRTLREWQRLRVITSTRIKRVVLFDPVQVRAQLRRFETQAIERVK